MQNQDGLIRTSRIGQLVHRSKPSARVRSMQRSEPRIQGDSDRSHRARQVVTRTTEHRRIQPEAELVEVGTRIGLLCGIDETSQRSDVAQQGEQLRNVVGSQSVPFVQTVQLRDHDCRLQLGQWIGVVASLRLHSNSLSDLNISRDERTAASRCQQLAATEAQHSHITPSASDTAMHLGSGHLASILDDANSMLIGKGSHRRHCDDSTVQVRGDDRFRLRRSGRFELIRVELSASFFHIHQHWLCSDSQNVFEVSLEVVSGQDDLVAKTDLQTSQGQFDGRRPAARQHDMLATVHRRETIGQLTTVGAVIFSP